MQEAFCVPPQGGQNETEGEPMYIADLHIHSRFSRATSRDCDAPHLDWWARRKGIRLLGTGDFTHPAWRAELTRFAESVLTGGDMTVEQCIENLQAAFDEVIELN